MNKRRSSAYQIAVIGLLVALLLLQTFVPMFGYIRILPGVAITTMHLTVITAAIILGPKYGSLMGFIWGCISLTVAWVMPSDPLSILLFRNPIIAIVPRVLCGLFAGLVAYGSFKAVTRRLPAWRMVLAGVSGALTNTIFVIAGAWLFYASSAAKVVGHGANSSNLGFVMIALLGVNAVTEAITAGILTPLIGRALQSVRRK